VYVSDQESPLAERWGGWYATGPLASKTIANLAAPDGATAQNLKLAVGIKNVFDRRYETYGALADDALPDGRLIRPQSTYIGPTGRHYDQGGTLEGVPYVRAGGIPGP